MILIPWYSNESGDYLLQYYILDSSDNEGVAERYVSISCDQQEGEGEGETVEGESEGEAGEGEVKAKL